MYTEVCSKGSGVVENPWPHAVLYVLNIVLYVLNTGSPWLAMRASGLHIFVMKVELFDADYAI